MTTKTFRQTLRRAALCSCVAFALIAAAVPARADNPPKLSDAAATAYLQKVSDASDALLKALQAKDDAKSKDLGAKFMATMNDGDAVMGKLSPDDQKTAGEWASGQLKKLTDAGWTPTM